eukprot:611971_1
MAEGVVDTGNANNEQTKSVDYSKVLETKLKTANLSGILDQLLHSNNIETSDLFGYDKSQMKSMIKSNNIKASTMQIIKFTRIVLDVKKTIPKKDDIQSRLREMVELGSSGSTALRVLDKIEKLTTECESKSFDKANHIEQMNKSLNKAKNDLDTEYLTMTKRLDTLKKTMDDKVDFYRDLLIQTVQNWENDEAKAVASNHKSTFLQEWNRCVEDPAANEKLTVLDKQIDEAKKSVDQLSKPKVSPIKASYYGKDLHELWSFRPSNPEATLNPMRIKCDKIAGNIVHVQWGPKPWEDSSNTIIWNLFH